MCHHPKSTDTPMRTFIQCCLLCSLALLSAPSQAQERVHFSIKNPTLTSRFIEFKHWDTASRKPSGYGYALNGLANHATTLPVGTRIYIKDSGKRKLLFVITSSDQGQQLSLNKPRPISKEQWQEVANQEINEETANLPVADSEKRNSIEQLAQQRGIPMVKFTLRGSTFWPRQVYVRVQLPWETHQSNVGFSSTMSMFSEKQVSYPVGSKVYSCDGAYWEGKPVKQRHIVTVDTEKSNVVFKL